MTAALRLEGGAIIRLTESTALAARDFVAWPASRGQARGRVESVHKASKVPGVPVSVVGTELEPAARVRLYVPSGNGWAPTEVFLAHPLGRLTRIDPLPEPSTEAVVAGSFDDIREKVRCALREQLGTALAAATGGAAEEVSVWIADIGPDWVVYSVNYSDDYWLGGYAVAGDVVELAPDPVQVYRQTSYVPVADPAPATEATEPDRILGRLLGAKGVDDAGGRVFRVEIIRYGDSANSRRYTESVMRAAAPLYEGAKAYDHHRSTAELTSSTLSGLVGTYRNVEATTSGLEADLHLLPSATHVVEALEQSLENQTAGLPPLVGISHDVLARYRHVVDGTRKLVEATQIVKVNSADVVADPAAGGQVRRLVAGGINPHNPNPTPQEGNPTVNLRQLLELLRAAEAARRPELLLEHHATLTSAGVTADEALRLAEALPAPAPAAPARATESTEATFAASSIMARTLTTAAVAGAGLDARLVESVLAELPATVTEADIVARVNTFARIAEGFERAGLRPTIPAAPNGSTTDELDRKRAALDAFFDGNFTTGYRSFKEAYIDWTGAAPRSAIDADLNRQILRESVSMLYVGERVMFDSGRATESLDSTSWSSALGDSMTRRLIAEYAVPQLQNWRQIVSSIVPINDFRSQKLERLGGYSDLPTVNQGAPYQALSSPGNDSEVTYALTKKGGTEDLTLEMIANDDVRAIARIPRQLGRIAALTLHRYVWNTLVLGNPTIYDSTALFAAGHGNTATSALSRSALDTITQKLMVQAAYGSPLDILALEPKFLVVPATLRNLAWTICNSPNAIPTAAPDGAASNIPNIHQGIVPIVLPHRDATSTTEWFVIADPALCPTIELGFYQGNENPELFVQNDPTAGSVFNADKVTYKIRHIYAGAVLDFRGFQRGNA